MNRTVTFLAIASALGTPAASTAQNIDLEMFTNGVQIVSDDNLGLGISVSGAGDVNGDGLSDVIVGLYAEGPSAVGESYVVFGKASNEVIDLGAIDDAGFRIEGREAAERSGFSVSGVGDFNGDGLADLAVGTLNLTPAAPGETYLVFGKATDTPVDLGALSTDGIRISGTGNERSGNSVSGAGDVNGDGLADVIVGAYRASLNGFLFNGAAYVIFGRSDATAIDLGALGAGGFRIDGSDASDRAGISVSGAGDVNGDGLADIIVGADGAGLSGESYVIFGKTDSLAVEVGDLGSRGFLISGAAPNEGAGRSVAAAGDVNADGLADLIIGAPNADPNGNNSAGESYVVFGKAENSPIDLSALGSDGYVIQGIDADDESGFAVSGAGDVNGDGFADVIVGARGGDPNGREDAGESYVVFGKTDSTPVDLSVLANAGIQIDGAAPSNNAGYSVSGSGDFNGDGLADLILGATGDSSPRGESYVVFSTQVAPSDATYRAYAGPGNAPQLAVGITGDGSNDSHPDSRTWIDFADGEAASLVTVTLTRGSGDFPGAVADVSWEVATNRTGWTAAEVEFRYLESEISAGDEDSLQLYYSADGAAPFRPLVSCVDPLSNTISAIVSETGFFFIGELVQDNVVFASSFESNETPCESP